MEALAVQVTVLLSIFSPSFGWRRKVYYLYYHLHEYYTYQGFNFNILCGSLMKSLLLPFLGPALNKWPKSMSTAKVYTLCISFPDHISMSFEDGLKTLKPLLMVDAETKVYWNLMAVSNSIFEAIMIRAALHSGIHCSDFKPFHLFHATWHDNLKEVNTTFF